MHLKGQDVRGRGLTELYAIGRVSPTHVISGSDHRVGWLREHGLVQCAGAPWSIRVHAPSADAINGRMKGTKSELPYSSHLSAIGV